MIESGFYFRVSYFIEVMDEKTILSKFDALVAAGDVIYDDEQRVVEHVEGGLKVCLHHVVLVQDTHYEVPRCTCIYIYLHLKRRPI